MAETTLPVENKQKSLILPASKKKIFIALLILIALFFLGIMFYIFLKSHEKLPYYSYNNFVWSESSDLIVYTREAVYGKDSAGSKDIRIVCAESSCGKVVCQACLPFDANELLPLGFAKYNERFYFLNKNDKIPQVYIFSISGRSNITNFKIPFDNIQKIIYSPDILFISYKEKNTVKIVSFNLITRNYIPLLTFPFEPLNNYELLDAAKTYDGRYFVFSFCRKTGDNPRGMSSIWQIDLFAGKFFKNSSITSFGNRMNIECSPDSAKAVIKLSTFILKKEKTELVLWSTEKNKIETCDIGDDRFETFKIFYMNNNRIFVKTPDKLFVLKVDDKSSLFLKTVFDINSLPMGIDDFIPSPSGDKLLLVKYLGGNDVKSDAWISNIDGTGSKQFICPEGKRMWENFGFYNYLRSCRRLACDLSSIFTPSKKKTYDRRAI